MKKGEPEKGEGDSVFKQKTQGIAAVDDYWMTITVSVYTGYRLAVYSQFLLREAVIICTRSGTVTRWIAPSISAPMLVYGKILLNHLPYPPAQRA